MIERRDDDRLLIAAVFESFVNRQAGEFDARGQGTDARTIADFDGVIVGLGEDFGDAVIGLHFDDLGGAERLLFELQPGAVGRMETADAGADQVDTVANLDVLFGSA